MNFLAKPVSKYLPAQVVQPAFPLLGVSSGPYRALTSAWNASRAHGLCPHFIQASLQWHQLREACPRILTPHPNLKSRDITLPTKVRLVKAMVLPMVMYGCESWTVKKDACRRTDGFELWCWRRLLKVPWTVRRSNQSILKEISPGCSLEGMMLKLKLQYFGHLMRRVDSLEKTLMLGGIGGRRRRGRHSSSPQNYEK